MNSIKPRVVTFAGLMSIAALTGIMVAYQLISAITVCFIVLGFILMVVIARYGAGLFWGFLSFLLLGYASFGKGFAYVGRSPIYVGELGLALSAISMLLLIFFRKRDIVRRFLEGLNAIWPILLFILWGALRTIPFVGTHGIDALRDAVVWGYSFYALAVFVFGSRETVVRFARIYGRVLPYFLGWLPVGFALTKLFPLGIHFPSSPVPIVYLKSGDVGVMLGGAAAFLLLRLDALDKPWPKAKIWIMWILWWTSWAAFGVSNRAGMLSALTGLGIIILMRPKTRWDRVFIIAILGVFLMLGTGLNVDIKGGRQDLSFDQFIDNFRSLVTSTDDVLEHTKQWRLGWWGTIIDYTIGGEYFWSGKGYGINLAVDDGVVARANAQLRSPHNISMTILARSGVIGLVIWIVLLGNLAWKTYLNSRRKARGVNRRVDLWLLAFFMAFLVNASFDVYLEGPMGGVWYWSVVGFMLLQAHGSLTPKMLDSDEVIQCSET